MSQTDLPLRASSTLSLASLESHLWEAANILRGSPVDRTDWKSYILPLLFFKRVCDVWDEEHAAMLAEYGEDFADEHRFQVPQGSHWRDVRATPRNVGTALSNAMRAVEAANQKHLYGVFGDAPWTNKDRLPDELLKNLIEHFSALPLGNERVANDVIGDAYEYLIKQFADSTNKKAGEFYTPRSVVRLMVDILDPREGETVYDPACGTGGMLLAAVEHVRAGGGDPRTFFGKLYGQEKNLTTAAVARMNLFLHGLEDFVIERGDTLRNPVFTDPSTGGLATFDVVIANPPFGLSQWGRDAWEHDPWGRANGGLPPESCGDFAWVQHMIASLKARGGRVGVVLPQGALFREKAGEDRIRQYLLERDLLEAVIGLAPNLFYGAGLAACILILRNSKPAATQRKVLFIDASDLCKAERNQNILMDDHVKELLALYRNPGADPRTSLVPITEIAAKRWSLNISEYVHVDPTIALPSPAATDAALLKALGRCRETEYRLRQFADVFGG